MYIHDLCWNVNRGSSRRSEFLYPTCKCAQKVVTRLRRERKNMFLWTASSDLCIVKGTWKGWINWQHCELQHRQMPSPTPGEEMLLPPVCAEHWPATRQPLAPWAVIPTALPPGQERWSLPTTQLWWSHTCTVEPSSGALQREQKLEGHIGD